MSGKILWTGIALSGLGLGYFLPIVLPVGAIMVIIGAVLMWLDK
jgi:hypothetical protein